MEAVNGVEYLIRVAENDPKTFCALLGRVLPLTIAGDAASPIKYQVVLSFGTGEDDLQASISGLAIDDNTLGSEIAPRAALPSPNGKQPH